MSDRLPRYLVFGGPLPAGLALQLEGVLELAVGVPGDDAADGLLVHARPEVLPSLRRFRDDGGGLPVYALAPGPISIAERIRWIREGADDLLSLETAAADLTRRLRSPGATRPDARPLPTGVRVDRWLQASARYVATRETAVAGLGEGGRTRYLDCVFLRDQVMRVSDGEAAPDVFGQRRGADREPLDWPTRVLGPLRCIAELENIGPDGACLALPVAPDPSVPLRVEITGEAVRGELTFEARWQRRVGRERWQVGVFTVDCRLGQGG